MKEQIRLFGKIKNKETIVPISLDRDVLWVFVKMWVKSLFTNAKFSIWGMEYFSKDEYVIVVQEKKS